MEILNAIMYNLNWIESNQIELDSDLIELNSNSTIGLRFNWIKYKLMEKILKIYYEYDVKKKPLKTQRFETTCFHTSFLWNGQNRFQFGTGQVMTTT
jgi:hypothetical protein